MPNLSMDNAFEIYANEDAKNVEMYIYGYIGNNNLLFGCQTTNDARKLAYGFAAKDIH